MADVEVSKDAPMDLGGETTGGSSLGTVDDDPLSFESTANDFLDLANIPQEKRGRATKALKAMIMACMSDDYGKE